VSVNALMKPPFLLRVKVQVHDRDGE
jgi:hypothetical protein